MEKKILFIVGASRSGTKLIRDLLNNHSQISLPDIESQFIIEYINTCRGDKKKTKDLILHSKFLKRINNFEISNWLQSFDLNELDDTDQLVMEVLQRSSLGYNDGNYWGDKTPFYLRNIELIKKVFPSSKFIHIIRDPRDRALSVNKTWGKNLFRSAHGWYTDITACRKQSQGFGSDYFEVYYEDLIQNTNSVLNRCCMFLSLDYEVGMDKLNKPSEKHGTTSKEAKVLSSNKNKTLEVLSEKQVQRLEEIVFPLFSTTNYKPFFATRYIPYSSVQDSFFKLVDYINFRYSVFVKKY